MSEPSTTHRVTVTHKGGKTENFVARLNNPKSEEWVANHLAEFGVHGEDAEHLHVEASNVPLPTHLHDLVKKLPRRIAPTISTALDDRKRHTEGEKKRLEEDAKKSSPEPKKKRPKISTSAAMTAPTNIDDVPPKESLDDDEEAAKWEGIDALDAADAAELESEDDLPKPTEE